MKKWHENIPPQGVLCKKKDGAVRLITSVNNNVAYYTDKCNGIHVDDLTPLTAAEMWQFMPFEPIETAPLYEDVFVKWRDGCVALFKFSSQVSKPANIIGWLPLPKAE